MLHQHPGEVLAFPAMVAVIAVAVGFAAPAQSRMIVVLGIVGAGAAWSLFAWTRRHHGVQLVLKTHRLERIGDVVCVKLTAGGCAKTSEWIVFASR